MGCTPVVHHVCCAVQVLDQWNKGELDSFLIEITANILKYKDTDGKPLVEKIKDSAGQVCGWEGRGVASGMVGGRGRGVAGGMDGKACGSCDVT